MKGITSRIYEIYELDEMGEQKKQEMQIRINKEYLGLMELKKYIEMIVEFFLQGESNKVKIFSEREGLSGLLIVCLLLESGRFGEKQDAVKYYEAKSEMKLYEIGLEMTDYYWKCLQDKQLNLGDESLKEKYLCSLELSAVPKIVCRGIS